MPVLAKINMLLNCLLHYSTELTGSHADTASTKKFAPQKLESRFKLVPSNSGAAPLCPVTRTCGGVVDW